MLSHSKIMLNEHVTCADIQLYIVLGLQVDRILWAIKGDQLVTLSLLLWILGVRNLP